ncbi:MAG TPA: DUF2336 domain-containing protein [Caulobacteraceae bacterium]|jgi:uncharacterized protein (DUF2336 family)|nr:DUF2336 domain-containing protein [Caulobacteraceae bacterium]
MAEPALQHQDPSPLPLGRARLSLLKRLADVVCLPISRVNGFERAMTGDLLVEMLREASTAERLRVAKRLANLTDIPSPLLRLLLRDDPEVARPLLEEGHALTDTDLIGCARDASQGHRRMIAARRHISEVVCEAVIEALEAPVVEALLLNEGAKFSQAAIETVVAASRFHGAYIPLLLRRTELKPSHAYILFWWAEPDARRLILTRFAVSREILQDSAGDVFPLAAAEGWQDPLVRKALQFIERRQRNRAAIEKSPFGSLEEAVGQAQAGMTRELASEIAYLSGLKPMTGAKIMTDPCGEPLAILCKATGLPRSAVRALWRGLRRPETDSEGAMTPALERTLTVYDMMAVDRAQTVLRYWNWALSSGLTPTLVRAIRSGDDEALDEFSPPQRAAMLALADDFGG